MTYKYASDASLRGSPAMVNIETGEIFINKDKWKHLDEYEKAIILLHEQGHYANKSIDEIKADCYAVDKYLSQADTPQRRAEIVRTIFCNVNNTPDNLLRKANLIEYLLHWEEKANESGPAKRLREALNKDCYAYWIGTAITIIGGAIKLGTSAYNLYQTWKNRTQYFDDYSKTEQEDIVTQCADAVIYDEFLRCGGNLTELYQLASAGPANPNGLAYKTFLTIAQIVPISPKWFDNVSQISAEQGSIKFWQNSGWTVPTWFQNRVDYLTESLEDYWDSLSLIDKIKYSNTYKIYAVIYILILIVLWQKL
jgi:hypothetical protein